MPSAQQVVIVIVTGASSGFGRLAATFLARAGHTVIVSMRATTTRNAPVVAELGALAEQESLALFTVDLDVQSQESVDGAVAAVVAAHGRLDVVVHNAGHMVLGPTEAFTPEQLAEQYDTNVVVGAHRVNRAALPHLRAQRSGLLVWVGSSSTRGGHPPFLGPYFAAKAAMDALAESYAAELIRFGTDTSIIVPGAYTEGTNHVAHAGAPADRERERDYDDEYAVRAALNGRLAALIPAGSDVQAVADEIVRIVELPAGSRPFRSHVDPSRDGSHVASGVYDRLRHEFYHRVGIEGLLPANDAL